MNQKSLLLFSTICFLLFSLYQAQYAPWPQYLHDFQFSNRASPGTPLPPTNLCPQNYSIPNFYTASMIFPNDTRIMLSAYFEVTFSTMELSLSSFEPVGTFNFTVIAVNPTGDTVYYISAMKPIPSVLTLGAMSGSNVLWEQAFNVDTSASINIASAAYNNIANTIEFYHILPNPSSGVIYYHIDAQDGSIKWNVTFNSTSNDYFYILFFAGADPFTGNPILGISTYPNIDPSGDPSQIYLNCYDESTGKVLWNIDPSYFDGIKDLGTTIISDNRILLFTNDTTIQAFSTQDGTQLWKEITDVNMISPGCLLQGTKSVISPVVFYGGNFGYNSILHVIDPVNGTILVSMPDDFNLIITSVVCIENFLVVSGYIFQDQAGLTYLVDLSNNIWDATLIANYDVDSEQGGIRVGPYGTLYTFSESRLVSFETCTFSK